MLRVRESAEAFGPVLYFWSDQFGIKIQFVGVSAVRRQGSRRVPSAGGAQLRGVLRPCRAARRLPRLCAALAGHAARWMIAQGVAFMDVLAAVA